MAYSVEDETYIALYAVWADPADDAANSPGRPTGCARWSRSRRGIQLADENLGRRPARFAERREHGARSTSCARSYDPDGRFHPWMGRL